MTAAMHPVDKEKKGLQKVSDEELLILTMRLGTLERSGFSPEKARHLSSEICQLSKVSKDQYDIVG